MNADEALAVAPAPVTAGGTPPSPPTLPPSPPTSPFRKRRGFGMLVTAAMIAAAWVIWLIVALFNFTADYIPLERVTMTCATTPGSFTYRRTITLTGHYLIEPLCPSVENARDYRGQPEKWPSRKLPWYEFVIPGG